MTTHFVSVRNLVDLIAATGLEPMLTELAGYIEADFRRWQSFEKSPRHASHSAGGVIELMPTSDGERFAFKYVNGHPRNTELGLPTVIGFGVLADVATGQPQLIAEMTILTALRTAATSAVAARHLARKDSMSMAIIGLGSQAEFQAYAFKALLGIKQLRVFDIAPGAVRKFLDNVANGGFEIVVARSVAEAVAGADIITTLTANKERAKVLTDVMVKPGVHINAAGGDCPGKTELEREILQRSKVFVEYTPQTRIEGEIQQLAPDFPVTELWQVIEGKRAGRTADADITVFDSVGFAIEDFAALRYIDDKIRNSPHKTALDLLATPTDPRDLFGLLLKESSGAGSSSDNPPSAL